MSSIPPISIEPDQKSERGNQPVDRVGSSGFDISTDSIRRQDRFDFFCDVIAARIGIDGAENWSDDFSARMSSRSAGTVSITNTTCSPARWMRSRRGVPDGEDWVMLRMLRSGRVRMTAMDEDFLLCPGMVAVFPSTIGGEMQILAPYRSVTIKAPRSMVETLMLPGHVIRPTLFQADDPAMKMLIGYVGTYLRGFGGTNTHAGQIAGRHIADLIALALGSHRDAQVETAGGGLKAVRTDAILRAIASGFASPFLSPAVIGVQLGISERHVHRLLEETNRTFFEHLLEARLSNAYCLFTAPGAAALSVTEVAEQSGFTNLSYFSRAFRQRFGETPSGIRSRH